VFASPPTLGVCCIDIKGKDLQIGMLEVIENKGRFCAKEGTFQRVVKQCGIKIMKRGWGGLVAVVPIRELPGG
jgi:hypothetical protein